MKVASTPHKDSQNTLYLFNCNYTLSYYELDFFLIIHNNKAQYYFFVFN